MRTGKADYELISSIGLTLEAGLNPKIMWELSAEDFKKSMSEKEYVEYFEKHNYFKEFKDVVFSIEEVSIAGNKARVKMRLQAKAIDEILYDRWIFLNMITGI